jgi:hypothetical protein
LIVLAEGTSLTVQIARDTFADHELQGDPIEFFVSDDVYSTDPSHTLMIAKGAVAMGRVISSSISLDHGFSGKLTFTCEYIMGVNGKKVWLRGTPVRSAVKTQIQAKHGGPLAQLGQALAAKQVGYHAGTQFTVYVDQDATL